MAVINDWKPTTEKGKKAGNYHVFVLKETDKTMEELVSSIDTFREFCKFAQITTDEFISYVKKLCIKDRDLFDWKIWPYNEESKHLVLFEKNGVYREEHVVQNGCCKYIKTYSDVCITSTQYVSLAFNKILTESLLTKFPVLRSPLFNKKVRRDPKVYECLPENLNTKVSDLMLLSIDELNITILDLMRYYNDREKFFSEEIDKPLFKVYADGDIFFDLTDDEENSQTLYVRLEELLSKDWKKVSDREVHSIRKPDGTFYSGPQTDAPYFNNQKVEDIRKALFE